MDSGFTATQKPMPAMMQTVFFNPCNHDNFLKILKYHKVIIVLHREQIKQEVTHQKGLSKIYMIWKTLVIGYIYSISLRDDYYVQQLLNEACSPTLFTVLWIMNSKELSFCKTCLVTGFLKCNQYFHLIKEVAISAKLQSFPRSYLHLYNPCTIWEHFVTLFLKTADIVMVLE